MSHVNSSALDLVNFAGFDKSKLFQLFPNTNQIILEKISNLNQFLIEKKWNITVMTLKSVWVKIIIHYTLYTTEKRKNDVIFEFHEVNFWFKKWDWSFLFLFLFRISYNCRTFQFLTVAKAIFIFYPFLFIFTLSRVYGCTRKAYQSNSYTMHCIRHDN